MRYQHTVLRLVCGDETTAIAAPGDVHASHMPYPMTVTGVRASLTTGPGSGTMLVDVQEEGVSILAAPISLIAGETSSTVASNLPFIVDDVLGDATRITVVVVDEASGDAAGLKVDIIGHRWIIGFTAPYGLSGPSGEGVGLPVVPLTPPPLLVTITQGASQTDPTSVTPIVFDVVFSDAVTGFATGDVTLSGTAGATTATVVDSGDHVHFTVNVTGMTANGTVIAAIPAGVCTSLVTGASNAAATSTDNSVQYVVPLTVTINQGASQADPATGSSIVFDVVFSEAVTGFATGDVTLSGTAGATTATVSGSGANYTVTVTGMTTVAGTVIADIGASVCTAVSDGHANAASTSSDHTVTWLGSNVYAHYDASVSSSVHQSGGAVSQWDDLSGNGYHLTQATGGAKPTTGSRTQNSKNVLDFDGGDFLARAPGGSPALANFASANYTVFIVCGSDADSASFLRFMSLYGNITGNDYDTASAWTITQGDNTKAMAAFQASLNVAVGGSGASPFGTYTVRKDTVALGWQVTNPAGTTASLGNGAASTINGVGLVVGGGYESSVVGTSKFDGVIAEIIIYTVTLSDADRTAIRNSLIAKWGA